MDDFKRINELKKYTSFWDNDDIKFSDLSLKDENGKTFLEHIIKNNVSINNKELLKQISNDYDILRQMLENRYILNKYYNIDLLFEERNGKSLIEIMAEKSSFALTMNTDIQYRLFEKTNGFYAFEKLLNNNNIQFAQVINKINNFDTLYNCLHDIGRLELMKYANERCWLSKTKNNKTMLEELIDSKVDISYSTYDKSYLVAEILYNKKDYTSLLKMDCKVLMNYPDKDNNYFNLIIQEYLNTKNNNILKSLFKRNKNIFDFESITLESKDNKSLAEANIILLENGIKYKKPKTSSLFNLFNLEDKPVFCYMYEMNKDLVLKNFDNNEILELLKKYISKKENIESKKFDNLNIDKLLSLLPQKDKFEKDLTSGKITSFESNTYYLDGLIEPMENDISPFEYILKNNIPVNTVLLIRNVEEILLLVKYNKQINHIKEELLYEKIDENKTVFDLLIENKYIDTISYSINKNFRVLDYCEKYNRFDFLSDEILEELFIKSNGHFLAEKYLNNQKFIEDINNKRNFTISDDKLIKLYKLGYKNILQSASENVLLTKIGNDTILDDLLNSNISPTFKNYDFKSPQLAKILIEHNRPDLIYCASSELLMNYPTKENNYLQYLIDCYKKGINVNFEKTIFKEENKELMARSYIQLAQNDLEGFLDDLDENDLLIPDNSGKNLLTYLISIDKDLTLNKILGFDLQTKKNVFAALKLLGIEDAAMNISYDKFNCGEICRQISNENYSKGIISPVEDLLEELKYLFENDGQSDKGLIEALITSYRYTTSVNPIFIEEVKRLIEIKKSNESLYYTKTEDCGCFIKNMGVMVNDSTISTLNHETGHALHWCMTKNEVPEDFLRIITDIKNRPEWISMVDQYARLFEQYRKQAMTKAETLVKEHINISDLEEENQKIDEILHTEKQKLIEQYIKRGYDLETLEIVLADSFTKEEFIRQKQIIEIREVTDQILRYDQDALSAVGDIIDAVADGKFRSNLLLNEKGEKIPPSYGHGVKYYNKSDKLRAFLEIRFAEMIANYSAIIKSKHSEEVIMLLKQIVGEELVSLLDNFYKEKMLKLPEYEYKEGGIQNGNGRL